ncbi:Arc family DNA-binding protein [Arsenicitalea aurantiaca]|uniref:Arc family DNA-binding protein n=1 Tax=Arsenicitalea aurantiaca TaxID=1783274 RepID=A0A433XEX9_9HYPH|nr:Arc family DNA-binding protein [Arsenicitalea aurantiaca]RUT32622.1 Arc family DNA-binding protein [Arsenicitalea aurantiaca]
MADADPITVRVPGGMRDRIRERARANRRSMNSEIVHYLDRALEAEKNEGPAEGATSPSHGSSNPPCKDIADEQRTE